MTWLELAKLPEGATVRFVEPWDIFPDCLIPAGATATIVEQGLNKIWPVLRVRPDDESQRGQLRSWDCSIHLYGPDEGTCGDARVFWKDEAPVEAVS